MFNDRIYNFSAGPSVLPEKVLQKASTEMLNYNGSGMSVMEMSHRSKVYIEIFNSVKEKLKKVMEIPDSHEILFLQGGATGQFAAVPLNLIGENGSADYAITGNFSKVASEEAKKYGIVNIACDTSDKNHTYIPEQKNLRINNNAAYFHYCSNNTIYGTAWKYIPDTGKVPLITDMSSNILSEPIDVSKFGIIYAGAQKNMAPAGFAVVIIKKDLNIIPLTCTPKILNYNVMIKNDSMPNTPPTYNIYILGLVLDWIQELGGLSAMQKINQEKANILYDYLDNSSFYIPHASKEARSMMNITFRTNSVELDEKFAKESSTAGFSNLKGHRSVGGMRASIYNAMPIEGVKKLVDFMSEFEKNNK